MDITSVLARYSSDTSTEQLSDLSAAVAEHLERVRKVADERDFVDIELAGRITAVLIDLIDRAVDYTARERALLAGAVQYFIDSNDVNSDLGGPTGFEDDAEILNAVCVYLGRKDLTLDIT